MKKYTKQGKKWKLGTALAALFVMVGTSSAQVLINDDFATYDSSVWTAYGTVGTDLTFDNPGLNLRTATTGNAAALTSNDTFNGATGTLSLTMTVGYGGEPLDLLGFIDASNFGGSGSTPDIIFRTDQTSSGGTAYLSTQVNNGGSINDLRNTTTLLEAGDVLGITWSPTQILFSVNGTVIETYNDAISGAQNVEVGQYGGGVNTEITDLELQSVSVPEPSTIGLMVGGLAGLLVLLRHKGNLRREVGC